MSIDEVVMGLVDDPSLPLGRAPIIEHGTVGGQPSRLILPSDDQPEQFSGQAALVVAYPRSLAAASPFDFLGVYTLLPYIRAVADSIVFLEPETDATVPLTAEELSARAHDLLADLVETADSQTFGDVHKASFMWYLPVAQGDVQPVAVSGWRIVADSAATTLSQEVNAYLYERGLVADPYNVAAGTLVGATGYGGEHLVCLVAERVDEGDAHSYRLEVMCGPRPQASDVSPVTTREFTPEERMEMLGEVSQGNLAFALDLYRRLGSEEGNLFFSPYSIRQALAMVYEGARGRTAAQMAAVLRFPEERQRLHLAYALLTEELRSRGESAREDATGFELHVANALWSQAGYAFLEEFLDALETYYGAGLRSVDFSSPGARETINAWVAEQTQGRVQNVLPPGAINNLTRLVLTNAIYYRASWLHPFEDANTTELLFYPDDGREVLVPTMRQAARLRHAISDQVTVVELPYVGGELVMTVVMPPPGGLGQLSAELDPDRLQAILSDLEWGNVKLNMPRFRIESRFGLADTLAVMGMADAFRARSADFSGMDGTRELFVSAVAHKAYVEVDEAGTEAAAATAVAVGVTSAPAVPVEISIDHPFLFLIRDRGTGTILFMGQCTRPEA